MMDVMEHGTIVDHTFCLIILSVLSDVEYYWTDKRNVVGYDRKDYINKPVDLLP